MDRINCSFRSTKTKRKASAAKVTLVTLLVFLTLLTPSAASGAPRRGNYTVGHQRVHIASLGAPGEKFAEVFFPSSAPPSNETRYPVVGVAHGQTNGGNETYHSYLPLYEAIASFGFIVVAPGTCPWQFCFRFYEDLASSVQAVL